MTQLLQQHLAHVLPDNDAAMQALQNCQVQLKTAAAVCKQELVALCDADSQKLLTSIPGIGVTIAASLIAEIGDISRFKDAKALVAYAGLDPRKFQSGTTLNRSGHITKRGSPHLRRSLYLAATIAKRHDPHFHALYEKKRAEGRKYREAIVVVSRAMLRTIYAMWTSDRLYEPKDLT
jgi:transposase